MGCVHPTSSILLVFTTLLSVVATGHSLSYVERWRYAVDKNELIDLSDSTHFVVGRQVLLEYLGPSTNFTWELGSTDCSFDSTNFTQTTISFQCTASGLKTLYLHFENSPFRETVSINIAFEERASCYMWYIAAVGNSSQPGLQTAADTVTELRLWIVDPITCSEQERHGIATVPSESSKLLTNQLKGLGEGPTLEFSDIFGLQIPFQPAYDPEKHYWIAPAVTPQESSRIPITIRGRDIAVMSCDTGERRVALSVTSLGQQFFPSAESITLRSGTLRYSFSACAPNIAALYSADGDHMFYLSLNRIASSNAVVLPNITGKILAIAFSRDSVIVVTQNGTTQAWVSRFGMNPKFRVPNGLAGVSITRLAAVQSCAYTREHSGKLSSGNNYVTAWDDSRNSSLVFVSHDGGHTFGPLVLPQESIVVAMTTLSAYPYHVLLLRSVVTGLNIDVLWLYDYDSHEWIAGASVASTYSPSLNSGIAAAASGSGELIVWSGSVLLYSPDGGRTLSPMTLQTHNENIGMLNSTNEEIVQSITSVNGSIAVLTSLNRLFYGKLGLSDVLEIQSGIPVNTTAVVILFDEQDQLQVVTLSKEISDGQPPLDVYYVPIANEMLTTWNVPDCPYIVREDTMNDYYVIDRHESIHIEARLLPRPPNGNRMSFVTTNQRVLEYTASSEEVPIAGVASSLAQSATNTVFLERRQSITVTERNDGNVRGRTGNAALRLGPLEAANQRCHTVQRIAHVRVGCPPGRRLAVNRTRDGLVHCSEWEHKVSRKGWYRYTEEQSEEKERQEAAKDGDDVDYDYGRFGCPFRVYHGTSGFKPTISLFDGADYVGEVKADYVLWELNGRTDWSYSRTVGDVECISKPQTWDEMTRNGKRPKETAWTRNNYRSCFEPPDSKRSGSFSTADAYEILNGTSKNGIVFTGDEGGLFLFRLRVVDPHQSYCDLTAEFAIDVYGAPLGVGPIVGIVVGFIGLVVGAVMAGFFLYKRQVEKEHRA